MGDLADDMYQYVIIELLKKDRRSLRRYDESKMKFSSYLYMIAATSTLHYFKEVKKRRNPLLYGVPKTIVDEIVNIKATTGSSDPEKDLKTKALLKYITPELEERYLNGRSVEDMAKARKVPESRIWTALREAKKNLLEAV
jgi:DNA-directed RNA polymerase specialized sigma24 family protein